MNSTRRSTFVVAAAAFLAFALVGTTSMPLTGLGGTVSTASAASYVQVSSLGRATRATSIAIPRLAISLPIRETIPGATISSRWAYHFPGTSWPGGHSNTYLYAHARAGAFLNLKYARVGDRLIVRLVTGRYLKYRVTSVRSVAWNDMRVLRATSTERITLQTCLGSTKTARRLIVIAVPA